jgi:hypothetical protein
MPIDPRIALGVQPSTFDPATAIQNALTIRNAQQTNQLNQMKLASEQQTMEESNALRNYLSSADLSTPEGLGGLYRYGTSGAATAKAVAERLKLQQETATSKASEKKNVMDEAKSRQEWLDQAFQNLASNPSNENIVSWVQDAVINGYMDQAQAASTQQQMLSIPIENRSQHFRLKGMSGAQKSEAQRRADETAGETEQRAETKAWHERTAKIDEANVSLRRREVELKEAENKRDQATFDLEQSTAGRLGITPKAFRERENNYPAATASNESANNAIDAQIADLIALRDHPSLPAITGPYDSRTKGVQFLEGTKDAQSLFNKVVSGQTLQSLIDLRRSSPTGAGLSSISDKDMATLREGTGLDQSQYSDSLKKRINEAISKLENAKTTINNQYSTTYSYKSGGKTPAKPSGKGTKEAPIVLDDQ